VSYTTAIVDLLDAAQVGVDRRISEFVAGELGRRDRELVLCGAGVLGSAVLRELRQHGRQIAAFADNASHVVGTTVDGIRVHSVAEAVQLHPDAAFVTTVYNPSTITAQLRGLGIVPTSTRALLLSDQAFHAHWSMGSPRAVLEDVEGAVAGADIWADAGSQSEYEHQLRWQLLMQPSVRQSMPPSETYFPGDIVRIGPSEHFVDCGAFDGDSARALLARTAGSFSRIDAFEADPVNQARFQSWVASLDESARSRVHLHRAAVSATRGTLRFAGGAGPLSTLAQEGELVVDAVPLDAALEGLDPTFLKVDVEGAEHDVIAGARETIRRAGPFAAICLYHRASDLWTIPLALRQLREDYRLYLRRYAEDCWETVCYAVPSSRVI